MDEGRMVVHMRVGLLLLLVCFGTGTYASEDAPQRIYQQAMIDASAGHMREAISRLEAAMLLLPSSQPWRARMEAASVILSMQKNQQDELPVLQSSSNNYLLMANQYAQQHPVAMPQNTWIPAVLSIVLPGSGHAWMGRWRDALTTVLMVWPMFLLTLWAVRRDMGPVVVFFAIITTWLWSGTSFSAMSLAERVNHEYYLHWWQQLWLASGLGGTVPW